ncbi:hypothetical protein FOZG_14608 [Fusarium oxysporum Fo47]|uniref:Uncharacterized protein n=1 Tax=Fusarium oxysporum Fo47 TaxID=660027 RepID=W9JHQ1_FUSOX|nr:hypothetical protein FOZG_14608 [Fusarium oxysporum Fo47]
MTQLLAVTGYKKLQFLGQESRQYGSTHTFDVHRYSNQFPVRLQEINNESRKLQYEESFNNLQSVRAEIIMYSTNRQYGELSSDILLQLAILGTHGLTCTATVLGIPPEASSSGFTLGHYGFIIAKRDGEFQWYTSNFYFVPSDVLPLPANKDIDVSAFMHLDLGERLSDHHRLFFSLTASGERDHLHHTSYEVEDFDTQLLGHSLLASKGHEAVGRMKTYPGVADIRLLQRSQ